MLEVNHYLCIGCGICAQNCPQKAITIIWNKAFINQERCIKCLRCQKVCPRGAIREKIPSLRQVRKTCEKLEKELEDILKRIEKLEVDKDRK